MATTHTYGGYMLCCPSCNRMVKLGLAWFGLFPMRSGLGPAEFVCTKCDTVYESGLQEWAHMSKGRKINFIFHSLVYAIIGGFFTAGLILVIEGAATNPDISFFDNLATGKLLIIWGCIAGVVLLTQALRVSLSLERTMTETKPYPARYTDWQINLQAWVLKILIVSFIGIYLGLKYFG
ncbi:MAG: hypothetical protein P8Z42_10030 [Anaerolineales bacterium]|jgi:hypothetical protein